jgi:hypothetical protein
MGHVCALMHLVVREAVYCTYRNKNFWLIEFSHGLDPKRPIVNVRFRQSGLRWRFAFCLLARSIHPARNQKRTTNTMNDGRD